MPRFEDGGAIEQDDDGTVVADFFKLATRGRGSREPMHSEIQWILHFDPAYYDAKDKRAKEKKQMQFLGDAWKYLSENDPDAVRELEEELDQPNYRKWQSWFEIAKVYKEGKLREREARRARRLAQARRDAQVAGIPAEEVEVNSDSSGDDSGFEDDEAARPPARRRHNRGESADMPPPSLPHPRNNRRGRGNGNGSSGPARKRPRHNPKSKKGKDPVRDHDEDDNQLNMSGAVLNQTGFFSSNGRDVIMDGVDEHSSASCEHSNSGAGIRQYQPTVEDFDSDDQNSTFDFSTPEAPPLHANSPAGTTGSGLFVTPDHVLDRFDLPGGLSPDHARATISPNFGRGTNRTGYGAVLDARRRSSLNGLNSRNGSPVPSWLDLSRFQSKGSVLNANDHNNGGLTEDEAIKQAMRASMPPDEVAGQQQTNEPPERDQQETQAGREDEQQPVREDPPAGDAQAQAPQPEVQDHPGTSNEPNPTTADEDGIQDLTGED
ncbi:hypothetical protein BST61_g1160 [Cercospora zeina]